MNWRAHCRHRPRCNPKRQTSPLLWLSPCSGTQCRFGSELKRAEPGTHLPLSQPQQTQRELLFFANDLSLKIIFHSQNKLPRGLPPAAQKGELCSDCFPEGPSPTSTKPQKKTRAHFGFFFYQIGRVDEFWLKRDCSRGAAVTWRLVKWTRNVFLLFFFRNLVAWFFLLESYIFTYLLLN